VSWVIEGDGSVKTWSFTDPDAVPKALRACFTETFERAAFECTDDGKPRSFETAIIY
jgi:hypothetical protein